MLIKETWQKKITTWILENKTHVGTSSLNYANTCSPSLFPCSCRVYFYCQPHSFSYLRPVWSIYSCLSSAPTLTCSASCCSSLYQPTNCRSGVPIAFKLLSLVVVLTKSSSPYSYPLPLVLPHYPSETFGAVIEKNKKVECVVVPSCVCTREGQAVNANEKRRDRKWGKEGWGSKQGLHSPKPQTAPHKGEHSHKWKPPAAQHSLFYKHTKALIYAWKHMHIATHRLPQCEFIFIYFALSWNFIKHILSSFITGFPIENK